MLLVVSVTLTLAVACRASVNVITHVTGAFGETAKLAAGPLPARAMILTAGPHVLVAANAPL